MKRLAAVFSVRCKKMIKVTLLCTIVCIGQLYGMDRRITEFGKILHRDIEEHKKLNQPYYRYTMDLANYLRPDSQDKNPKEIPQEDPSVVFNYWWACNQLRFACLFCDTERAKKLIEKDEADVNGFSFLSLAIGNKCKPDMFKLLLDSGAYVHAIDSFGKTPLVALENQRKAQRHYEDHEYEQIKSLLEDASKREKVS